MKIEPVDGIYVKIANKRCRICSACNESYWSDVGHSCESKIEDTVWFKKVTRIAKEGRRLKDKELLRTAKLIFDARIPNY